MKKLGLADWGGPLTARFERNSQIEFSVKAGTGSNDDALIIQSGRKRERTVLTQDARQVLQWIGARKKSFHGHQVVEALATVATARVVEILDEFVVAGLILRNGGM